MRLGDVVLPPVHVPRLQGGEDDVQRRALQAQERRIERQRGAQEVGRRCQHARGLGRAAGQQVDHERQCGVGRGWVDVWAACPGAGMASGLHLYGCACAMQVCVHHPPAARVHGSRGQRRRRGGPLETAQSGGRRGPTHTA